MNLRRQRAILALAALAAPVTLGGLTLSDSTGQTPSAPATGKAPATTPVASMPARPPVYVVHRAPRAVTPDDVDDLDLWKNATVVKDFFIPITYEKPKSRTAFSMLWDDEHLYFSFIAHDTDLRGTLKGRLAHLWTEDVVEFFFSPDLARGSYYELELAPTNELLALQIENTRRGTFEERAKWDHHIKTAVRVEGTINKSDDTDKSFRGLIVIAWKDLKFAGNKPPKVGDEWRFNVPRCDLSKEFADGQELSAHVPLPRIDFHISEYYGTMRFEK